MSTQFSYNSHLPQIKMLIKSYNSLSLRNGNIFIFVKIRHSIRSQVEYIYCVQAIRAAYWTTYTQVEIVHTISRTK